MDAWFGMAAILVGLASCFYGYPLFRIFLICSGLIYGYMLGYSWAPAGNSWMPLAIGVGAAVVLAALAYPLWSIGVIILGAALGSTILISLGLALNASQSILILPRDYRRCGRRVAIFSRPGPPGDADHHF